MKELQVKPIEYKVEWNYEEIKDQLNAELEPYRNPTELDKKSAKETVTFMNKINDAMNDRAKDIDKELSQPIKDFRNEVKELMAMVTDVQKPYKDYVEKLEAERIEERKAFIWRTYNDIFGVWTTFIPFDHIFCLEKDKEVNKAWKNATCSEQAITNEMKATRINLQEGITAISHMNLPFEIDAIYEYLRTFSIKAATDVNDALVKLAEAQIPLDEFPTTKKAEITATDSQIAELERFCAIKGIDVEWK